MLDFDNSQYFVFDKELISDAGRKVKVYELCSDIKNGEVLNNWAAGLRDYYIEENLIEPLLSGMGMTKKEYLEKNIFPSPIIRPGPSTMSGEFGEILVHDFIRFKKNYQISKLRYRDKINPNMPMSGSDVIGYKMVNLKKPNKKDSLFVGEVKTRASNNTVSISSNPLSDALKDSLKDKERIGESLNAEKRRLLMAKRNEEADIVQRFQNKTDNPYNIEFSAIAIFNKNKYSEKLILEVINSTEIKEETKNILVIYSADLMDFLKELYRRASEC